MCIYVCIYIYIYIYIVFNNLKFTLKHSYVFRSNDHPQGAHCVPVSRCTAQQGHRQPVSTEHHTTHTQHTTCCHSTKLI